MKPCLSLLFLLFLTAIQAIGTQSHADSSPTEMLKKTTRLTCTFTSEQQTRWGSGGPVKDEGAILEHITFDSIDHQNGEGRVKYESANPPSSTGEGRHYDRVRVREFAHSMTFFELTKAGEIDPVITTILDDYYSGTTKFIAVRSAHETSAFKRELVSQKLGTCVPGK